MEESLRVLLITQYWSPQRNVPQQRWRWLVEVLVGEGHDVVVLAPGGAREGANTVKWALSRAKPEKGALGEWVYRIPHLNTGTSLSGRTAGQAVTAALQLWAMAKIKFLKEQVTPDVIIGTVPTLPTAIVTAFAGSIFSAPFIIDLRDPWPDLLEFSNRWNESLGAPSFRERALTGGPITIALRLVRKALLETYKHAAVVIVTSRALQNQLQEQLSGDEKAAETTVALVRNVFPRAVAKPKRRERPLGGDLRLLYAGTVGRAQDLRNVVEAVGMAQNAGASIDFRILGSGVALPAVEQLCKERGVHASFEKKSDQVRLKELYQWADTALVPLADWEPLRRAVPSKTYELMEMEIPITAVASGETAALVEEMAAGTTVPPKNPRVLAEHLVNCAKNVSALTGSSKAAEWITNEREVEAPSQLLQILDEIRRRN